MFKQNVGMRQSVVTNQTSGTEMYDDDDMAGLPIEDSKKAEQSDEEVKVQAVVDDNDDDDACELAPQGQSANIIMEDNHRNTAIEFFENYFARAYKRKDNAPMNEKRFQRAIERVKKRENLEDEYIKQFQKLFKDAKKDDQNRVSSESLIDAIVVMI